MSTPTKHLLMLGSSLSEVFSFSRTDQLFREGSIKCAQGVRLFSCGPDGQQLHSDSTDSGYPKVADSSFSTFNISGKQGQNACGSRGPVTEPGELAAKDPENLRSKMIEAVVLVFFKVRQEKLNDLIDGLVEGESESEIDEIKFTIPNSTELKFNLKMNDESKYK